MTTRSKRSAARRVIAAFSACVLAATLSVVSISLTATPASACSPKFWAPKKATSALVSVRIHNDSCNPNAYFALARHRWFGWVGEKSRRIGKGQTGGITWNCSGVGTYNYRGTWSMGTHWHDGPSARLSC